MYFMHFFLSCFIEAYWVCLGYEKRYLNKVDLTWAYLYLIQLVYLIALLIVTITK